MKIPSSKRVLTQVVILDFSLLDGVALGNIVNKNVWIDATSSADISGSSSLGLYINRTSDFKVNVGKEAGLTVLDIMRAVSAARPNSYLVMSFVIVEILQTGEMRSFAEKQEGEEVVQRTCWRVVRAWQGCTLL